MGFMKFILSLDWKHIFSYAVGNVIKAVMLLGKMCTLLVVSEQH